MVIKLRGDQRVFGNWPQMLRVCMCLYLTVTKLAQDEALASVTTLDGGRCTCIAISEPTYSYVAALWSLETLITPTMTLSRQ